MSKPTHILVPIADLDKTPILFEKIRPILSSFPKVDLSEEGINERSKHYRSVTDTSDSYRLGYIQCAKDLLNTDDGKLSKYDAYPDDNYVGKTDHPENDKS